MLWAPECANSPGGGVCTRGRSNGNDGTKETGATALELGAPSCVVIITRPGVVPTSDSQGSEEPFQRGVDGARSIPRRSEFAPNADESEVRILIPNVARGARIES